MRLLISEQSPILRNRLTRLFSDLEFISMVVFVEELAQVKRTAVQQNPNVIVIDIDFPNHKNLRMLNALKEGAAQPKVFLLTETIEPRYIRQFRNSGVDMVFNKKDDLSKFIGHLNTIENMVKLCV